MAAESIILPKWHFRKRIRHQYSNIPLAIAREILQNSQDAGATIVKFELGKSSFKAIDNGKGMTLDEFRKFYLTLGGTKKDTGSIGGFGAAKELLSFAWESWECRGQGFSVTGSGADQPESNESGGIKRGFEVSAQDNRTGNLAALDSPEIESQLTRLCKLSSLTVKVKVNGEPLNEKGRKLRKSQLFRTYNFGKLYIHKSRPGEWEQTGYLYIRTKGLYTAYEYIGGDYVYYLELDAASPEVLNENRDSLRYEVKTRIQKDLQAISRKPERIERKPANPQIRVFGNLQMNGSEVYNQEVGTFDTNENQAYPQLWDKTFVMADNGKTKVATLAGNLRPMFAKALSIWDRTLGIISAVAEMDRPIAGLCQNLGANGIHFNFTGRHVICATTRQILKASPFALLELAIHEFAHYERSGHSQEYESARMEIARTISPNAMGILDTIRRLQAEPTKKRRNFD